VQGLGGEPVEDGVQEAAELFGVQERIAGGRTRGYFQPDAGVGVAVDREVE
jgi:hypothetical protein